MAAVPPEGEENSEPLKYKTWVLKVSIHCEGCKRKVKRILHSVEGVYTIDVDTKQHKVIVTGNVDANTLLRKLEKSGKHAQLWPDPHRKPKKINNSPDDQQQQQPPNEEDPNQPQIQNNPAVENPVKVAVTQDQQQHTEQPPNQNQGVVKEVRFEGNNPPLATGGAAKKKKKKKSGGGGGGGGNNSGSGQSNGAVNNEVKEQQQYNGGPPRSESPPPLATYQQGPGGPGSCPNMSPPGHNRVYEYPPVYHAGPPPVYAVSCNTAYPRSYAASYYSAPTPYSYAYVHHGADVDMPLPSEFNGMTSVQPSNTFEIFSDENPNACSVM